MHLFESIDLNLAQAGGELAEYKSFLAKNAEFKERDFLRQLKRWPQLSALIGTQIAGVARPDVYKLEFQIAGVFIADLVVGNIKAMRFVLVEFEGAEINSLFGPAKTNQMRHWSSRLEHGFGQLVDWAWAIRDLGHTDIFKNAFGCPDISATYLLVCGRDHHCAEDSEGKRFFWRSNNIMIQGTPAACLTYDGLARFLEDQLSAVKSFIAGS